MLETPRTWGPSPTVEEHPRGKHPTTHTALSIERKNVRVMGLVKTAVMLTLSVVGYNLDRIRSFLARAKAAASARPVRAKRRTGTLPQLLGRADEVASGRDPPPD